MAQIEVNINNELIGEEITNGKLELLKDMQILMMKEEHSHLHIETKFKQMI